MTQHATEQRAANILLQRGVMVQVATPLLFRWLGKKISLKITAPSTREFINIAHEFLAMGIKNTGEMELSEAFSFVSLHGKKMSKIIARSVADRRLPIGWTAYILRHSLTQQEMSYLFQLIIAYGGVEDFINTIRLMAATRITKPMNLSPAEKMS